MSDPIYETERELADRIVGLEEEVRRLREALDEIDQLVRYEWKVKDHFAGMVLNSIVQVLESIAPSPSARPAAPPLNPSNKSA